MSNKERLVTPIGEVKWSNLDEARKFSENGKERGDAKYDITIVFAPDDPEWAEFIADMRARVEASPGPGNPIKADTDKDEDGKKVKNGKCAVTFKTGDTYKPSVFDVFGEKIDNALVGSGSKAKVNFTPSEYALSGGGVTLYLNAVGVTELVERSGTGTAESFGFGVKEKPEMDDGAEGGSPRSAEEDKALMDEIIRVIGGAGLTDDYENSAMPDSVVIDLWLEKGGSLTAFVLALSKQFSAEEPPVDKLPVEVLKADEKAPWE